MRQPKGREPEKERALAIAMSSEGEPEAEKNLQLPEAMQAATRKPSSSPASLSRGGSPFAPLAREIQAQK